MNYNAVFQNIYISVEFIMKLYRMSTRDLSCLLFKLRVVYIQAAPDGMQLLHHCKYNKTTTSFFFPINIEVIIVINMLTLSSKALISGWQ